jgi:hypothetical protein
MGICPQGTEISVVAAVLTGVVLPSFVSLFYCEAYVR